MKFTNLIDTASLAANLHDPGWLLFDCRSYLDNPGLGRRRHLESHIPGAIYLDLESDLSGKIVPGTTGRHPLPDGAEFARRMTRFGLANRKQVVTYDDAGGAIAARLWWMLKWIGHESAAVLDGGWPKWLAEGRPARGGPEHFQDGHFLPRFRPAMAVDRSEVLAVVAGGDGLLWDARAGERFRGEVEPIDPVAGHIRGARSAPFSGNLKDDGTFQSPELLRDRFLRLLGDELPSNVICYCGSGVTAAHNILAMESAGFGRPRLYGGSWSEWITDPSNPIAVGPEDTEELE